MTLDEARTQIARNFVILLMEDFVPWNQSGSTTFRYRKIVLPCTKCKRTHEVDLEVKWNTDHVLARLTFNETETTTTLLFTWSDEQRELLKNPLIIHPENMPRFRDVAMELPQAVYSRRITRLKRGFELEKFEQAFYLVYKGTLSLQSVTGDTAAWDVAMTLAKLEVDPTACRFASPYGVGNGIFESEEIL